MAELVHAIVIMAFFHALSGFTLGCGLNPEIDTVLGHTTAADAATPTCSNPALGYVAVSPSSDSELTDSDALVTPPPNSPPSKAMSNTLMEHFIECE